jgi:2-dehydropantoate 2-reductase
LKQSSEKTTELCVASLEGRRHNAFRYELEAIMRIVVMGTGGVGGYFGAKLAAGGADVTFVARGAHGEAIRRDGLFVKSPLGDLRIHPAHCVADPAEAAPADAALFCVKLTDTEEAARGLSPVVAAGANVFTFQNGVESAEMLNAIFGEARAIPGVAYISAMLGSPGQVIHKAFAPRLEFGEADGASTPRVAALLHACQAAAIEAEASSNIRLSLWRKFALLAPFASLTALTRATIGQLREEPRTRRLLHSLIDEAVAVGMAKNVGLTEMDAARIKSGFDALDASGRASMTFDVEHGKPLESPYFSGAIVRMGEALGVPTPTNKFFADALAVWERGVKAPKTS